MTMRVNIKAEVRPWVAVSGHIKLDRIVVYVEVQDVGTDSAVTVSKFSWSWKSVEDMVKELPHRLEEIWLNWCNMSRTVSAVRSDLRDALERRGISHSIEVELKPPYVEDEDDC